LYCVPRDIKETKEKGDRFTHKPRYTETITQLSDGKISIKHGVDVIHSISHLIRANESRNTQFINGAKKLEALPVFADYSFLVSGWNEIPMSFGSICDIYHRCNEMLACCEPEWWYDRQYDTFGWEMGTTSRGKQERQMGSVVRKRGVPQTVLEKRGMKYKILKFTLRSAARGGCRSTEWNWGAPKDGGFRSAEWNRGEPIQAEQSTDGIEECLSQRRSAEMGWGKECGMHHGSAGVNWRAPIPGWGPPIGGSSVRNGIEEPWEQELIPEWNRRGSIKDEELRRGLRSAYASGVAPQGVGAGCDAAADMWLIV